MRSPWVILPPMSTVVRSPLRAAVQWSGLLGGPLLAVIVGFSLPEVYKGVQGQEVAFTAAGRATLAMMVWMATWWLTDAIDIEVTALLPLVMFPLLGAATMKAAAAPYAEDTIFLFMGGFLLALSMSRWKLDKRIALLTLRLVGTKPINMVGGFMLATVMISAFVSNTATAAMMLPIAMSVIALLERRGNSGSGSSSSSKENLISTAAATATATSSPPPDYRNFAICLLLGVAYASSIGGIATIIGSPPNTILVGFLKDKIAPEYRMEISFGQWLILGVPVVVIFTPITWFMLTRVIFPIRMKRIEGGRELIEREYRALGPPNRGEWITFIVFMVTAALWISRPWLVQIGWGDGTDRVLPLKGLTDPGIAMLAALVLFITPTNVQRGEFTMDWRTAVKLPWGILILFGGGLSLAAAVQANGVAEFIGSQTLLARGLSVVLIVIVVNTLIVFLGELTSNTATTAALLPVMAAIAPGFGVHPYLLCFITGIGASCSFMLPVGTPPNAMVFATGHVTIPQMCKAGLWLNLIGIVIVSLFTMLLLGPALGIEIF